MRDYSRYEPSITPRTYVASITVPEHRQFRNAVDLANIAGDTTWIKNIEGAPIAAIVPVSVALAGEDQVVEVVDP